MMKSKLARLAILVVLLGTLAILAWRQSCPAEPIYEGQPLSQWLKGHVPNSSADPPYGSPGWKEAELALRQIGTNAIPALLRMIRARDPHPAVREVLSLARRVHLTTYQYRYASQRNEEARYAFEMLGAKASNAVPELIKIYQNGVTAESRRCAADALGHAGPAAKAALPVLLKDFTHTNDQIRFDAVTAVLHIGGEPGVIIPAMTSMLKDPKPEIRWNASGGLERLGSRARPAVPDLLAALNDPATGSYKGLKEQFETVLWQVAPEKVGKPLVVEEATPLIAGGVTAELVEAVYSDQHRTLIQTNRPIPCLSQFWSSAPRGTISLYRRAPATAGDVHFLGDFEVLGIPPHPTNVNISLLCILVDQRIVLAARDNNTREFMQIRRVDKRPE